MDPKVACAALPIMKSSTCASRARRSKLSESVRNSPELSEASKSARSPFHSPINV